MDKDLLEIQDLTIDQANIINIITEDTGILFKDMKRKTRQRPISHARLISMFFLYKALGLKQLDIGRLFGYDDHTIVNYAVNFVSDQYSVNEKFRRKINPLCVKINPAIQIKLEQLIIV